MSCESCDDILEVDGVEPPCREGRVTSPSPGARRATLSREGRGEDEGDHQGCPIYLDRFGEDERRAIMVWNAIQAGAGMVSAETVLQRHQVDEDEFDLILAMKDEGRKIEAEKRE